jgi:dienelactone hydrolase
MIKRGRVLETCLQHAPRRIAILGFSFGGEVAHDTAFERLRAILVATGAQLLALAETRVGEKYVNVQVPKLWQQWHSK